jgi:choline kinase
MDAVVLAAGQGTRLGGDTPKCLLAVRGRTLLERHLDAAAALAAERCHVVVGAGGIWTREQRRIVRSLAGRPGCEVICNRRSLHTHSTASLALALEGIQEDVLIVDGDLIYSRPLLDSLSRQSGSAIVVSRCDGSNGSRVVMRSVPHPPGLVLDRIGEGIPSPYVYMGLMKIGRRDLDPYRRELMSEKYDGAILAELLDAVASRTEIACMVAQDVPDDAAPGTSVPEHATVVEGTVININTRDDYLRAERLFGE